MRQSRAEEKILGGREKTQHAQQQKICSKLEGNDPLGIMEHRKEIGF